MFWQPPRALQKLFPEITWKIKTSGKKIYLTFDDGPDPGSTGEILLILKKYGISATFFCLGKNVEKHPSAYSEILKGGHVVGNHGYDHLDGWKTSNPLYFANIEKATGLIQSSYFRPPYGRIKPSQIKFLKAKYKIICWDVMSYDFKVNAPEKCFRIVQQQANNGSIIVFHDSIKVRQTMIPALQQTVEYFIENRYQFGTITDVI